MATLEELTVEARQEIENAKPLYNQKDNVRSELTDDEYDQKITDLANEKWNNQQFGYKEARQKAYGDIGSQLDMIYWDQKNGTSTFKDHIDQVKSDNPKPS